MVLDEPTDTDTVFEVNGFKFIANNDFLEEAKPITIDYQGMGFALSSNIQLGGGCGSSCGTSCG
ncbi:MAG: hypothetical protein ACQERN_03725 [Thermodesulfobacteriota bacterium]